MKHALFLFLAFVPVQLSAQITCNGYFVTTKGATTEYNYYDGKNQLSYSSKNVVKDVQAAGIGLKATVETVLTDKKGKAGGTGSFTVTCDNGEILLDIRGFVSPDMNRQQLDAEVTVTGDGMYFPANPQVGQKLKDSNNEIKVAMGKVTIMNTKISIRDYVIEAAEKVTTTAGTFDTFKATYISDFKALIISGTAKTTIWFAKGVGIVKQEVYNNKNGKLESKMELMSLKK